MRSVACPCEAQFETEFPETVDLDSRDGAETEILSGDFLTARCPRCGNVVKPDLAVRVISSSRKLDVQVIPEMERLAFHRGAVKIPAGSEAVIGYRELAERIRAVRDGRSPGALEIIKYLLMSRAQQDAPEADIIIEYAGRDQGALKFAIWGVREGEAGFVRVPDTVYEKTLAELPQKISQEPFSRIFAGPYRSIRALVAELDEER
ncbi:MAG TPA: CpXC domain-containing protein [Magnetospirillaceae bacterium]|nr:CpXC domain-containing protein [Magnetospirillaceae bacterium]